MQTLFSRVALVVSGAFALATGAWAEPGRFEHDNFVAFQPENLSEEHRLLVIVPGANKSASEYESLAQKISSDSRVALWTAVLKVPHNIPVLGRLAPRLKELVAELRNRNAQFEVKDVFLAGHSLGGIAAQGFAKKNNIGGLVMLASYITRQNRTVFASREFPLPILTLGGELDGQTRITRVAAEFANTLEFANGAGEKKALRFRPTVVLPGVNHAAFANGVPVRGDLSLEIPYSAAQTEIASTVADFVVLNTPSVTDDLSEQRMAERSSVTQKLVAGYVHAKDLTQDWCVTSQKLVAAGFDAISVRQSIAPDYGAFIFSKPRIENTDITATAYFHKVKNPFDTSRTPEEADAVDCKMKNADAIRDALKVSPSVAGATLCRELNEKAVAAVANALSTTARQRFAAKGAGFVFEADEVWGSGIRWASDSFQLKRDKSGVARVRSPVLFTDLNAPDRFAGMFYCKLLSPARVAEWMLVDGLR
jgi:pimeloyl-ACP methyl ester carboxylesterase